MKWGFRDFRRWGLLSGALIALVTGHALARPLAVGGTMLASAYDTQMVGTAEMLAVWVMARLGVAVRNDPGDLRLVYGPRELRYSPVTGWRSVGFSLGGALPTPQLMNGSLLVPADVLRWLGVPVIADTPSLLDIAAPQSVPVASLPPSSTVTSGRPPTQPAPTPTPPSTVKPPEIKPQGIVPTPAPPLQPLPPVQPAPAPIPTPTTRPEVMPPEALGNLNTVRVSRTMYRTVEVRRVVLELSHPAPHQVERSASGLSIRLSGVTASASQTPLAPGDTLIVEPGPRDTVVKLDTRGGRSEIFTLPDPYRIVIDTTTYTDDSVPPPLNPDSLPDGVTYRNKGMLHLLSFDPERYQPRVVTAPLGRANDVAALVKSVGGVAGVNGGYFDPASNLPVDLVQIAGLMTSSSLEKRATIGFTALGTPLFGYPRPRYFLSGAFGTVMVNSVRASANADLLTAFVGDGRTRVGSDLLTTVYLNATLDGVQSALTGEVVPPAGTLAVTFDPARFPQLPRTAGAALSVSLNWQAHDAAWPDARDALAAGPLLVQDGKVALNPQREGFNTNANIWRPTRQVALGTLAGQPTIAYFEYGTPEAFAAALAGAGLRDAVRLDSGSSATVYLQGGYANLGAYLNTVWSRPVPNAIVFVPKGTTAKK